LRRPFKRAQDAHDYAVAVQKRLECLRAAASSALNSSETASVTAQSAFNHAETA